MWKRNKRSDIWSAVSLKSPKLRLSNYHFKLDHFNNFTCNLKKKKKKWGKREPN